MLLEMLFWEHFLDCEHLCSLVMRDRLAWV